MKGIIVDFEEDSKTGVIRSHKKLFMFALTQWESEGNPVVGAEVEYQIEEGKATHVCYLYDFVTKGEAVKKRIVAGLLAIGLGWLGVHRFYLGYYKVGIMQIIFTFVTLGFGAVWGFTEGFLIMTGKFYKDSLGRPIR